MSRYHINPETNRPNICKTEEGACKVATADKHFATLDEAKASLKLAVVDVAVVAAPKKAAAPKKTAAKPAASGAIVGNYDKVKPKAKKVAPAPTQAEADSNALFEAAKSEKPEVGKAESIADVVDATIAPHADAPAATPEADELLGALRPDLFEQAEKAKTANASATFFDTVEEKFEIVKDQAVAAVNSPVVTKTIENVKKDSAAAFSVAKAWGKDSFAKLKGAINKK